MITIVSHTGGTLRTCVLCGHLTTLRLEGELDMAGTDVLEAAACLVPAYAAVVTLDLGGLTSLDRTGAEALAAVHAAQVIRGRKVRIVHARPHVRRIFGILHMSSLLSTEQPRAKTASEAPPRRKSLETTRLPVDLPNGTDRASGVGVVPREQAVLERSRTWGPAPGLCGWCGHLTHPHAACDVPGCPCR
jgi:anti-anti-sigma regulatory factor